MADREAVKALRKQAQITLDQLAGELELSANYLAQLEGGQRKLTAAMVERIVVGVQNIRERRGNDVRMLMAEIRKGSGARN